MQLLRLPDGTVKVLVEGKQRARIKRFVENDGSSCRDRRDRGSRAAHVEIEALMRSCRRPSRCT